MLDALFIHDRRKCLVRLARRCIIVQFDIVDLGATNDFFLQRRRHLSPGLHVVQVFLNHHVASTTELRVFVSDQCRMGDIWSDGIGGSIHESQQVARIEIAEALYLVDYGDAVAKRLKQQTLQFKTQIQTRGPNVKQNIAGRGGRVVLRPLDRGKRLELLGPRLRVKALPEITAQPDDARQPRVLIAKADRLHQVGDA